MSYTTATNGLATETSSRGERARDDEPLHFASAFVDLAHADVAIDALDGIIGEVAVAAWI